MSLLSLVEQEFYVDNTAVFVLLILESQFTGMQVMFTDNLGLKRDDSTKDNLLEKSLPYADSKCVSKKICFASQL